MPLPQPFQPGQENLKLLILLLMGKKLLQPGSIL